MGRRHGAGYVAAMALLVAACAHACASTDRPAPGLSSSGDPFPAPDALPPPSGLDAAPNGDPYWEGCDPTNIAPSPGKCPCTWWLGGDSGGGAHFGFELPCGGYALCVTTSVMPEHEGFCTASGQLVVVPGCPVDAGADADASPSAPPCEAGTQPVQPH